MTHINPYIHFNGNAEEAFDFYKSVFGGEYASVARYGDMPDQAISEADAKKIMHIALPISGNSVLMGSDMPPGMTDSIFGTNFTISVHPDTEDDTRRLFDGLSAGGRVTVPLEKTFWSALFGMCIDKYGIHWMVNCQQPQ